MNLNTTLKHFRAFKKQEKKYKKSHSIYEILSTLVWERERAHYDTIYGSFFYH